MGSNVPPKTPMGSCGQPHAGDPRDEALELDPRVAVQAALGNPVGCARRGDERVDVGADRAAEAPP